MRVILAALLTLSLVACQDAAPAGTTDASAGDVALKSIHSTRLYVFDTITFTREKPLGVAPGFDLDGRVSDEKDKLSCGKVDFVSPEGVKGIDNQFARLVPLIEASGLGAFEGLLQTTIKDGGLLLMLQVQGIDDIHKDPEVHLSIRAGQGTPLLGTDGLLLSGQTFHRSGKSPETDAGAAQIDSDILTAGPFDVQLPVVVFGKNYVLELRKARIRARITPDGGLSDGILGGGITLTSIAAIAEQAAQDQPSLLDMIHGVIGDNGDLAVAADGTCGQISAALKFSAVSAFLFEDVTATATK